ncbi:hypothetical protein [Streptomyces sp. NBC_00687]|uniref:hypothetical protein n=1 Tax=Streptomyces sp. NBC_00687 TaxID=2975807 RepID=UPI00224F0ADB|nr:hypothetical protein [Streptomyces sp. NBC_00687]MCX4920015.1 hypothetical protein [Streptomyces sp. NBC_00687]
MNEERFGEMAGQLARASLDSWRAGNRAFAVLHCGIGCEHILKALLCHHDPLLISEKGDRAHRFHALGFGSAPGVKPLAEARTIGITEAFRDATVFMNGRMPLDERGFHPVAVSRNGVAHYAHHNDESAAEVVTLGLQVIDAVRAELCLDSLAFWGEYQSVFTNLDKVADLPSQKGPGDRPTIEGAAEHLARHEGQQVISELTAAAQTAQLVTSWGAETRQADVQETVARTTLIAALLTALGSSGYRIKEAVRELLVAYDIVPYAFPLEAPPSPPEIEERARTAVMVKVVLASSVGSAIRRAHNEFPALSIAPLLAEVSASGRLLADRLAKPGARLWWHQCPACGYAGNVYGDLDPRGCSCEGEWDICPHDDRNEGVGSIEAFSCPFCGLLLNHSAELAAAGVAPETAVPADAFPASG